MAGRGALLRRCRRGPATAFLLVSVVAGLTACGGAKENPYGLSNFAGASPAGSPAASSSAPAPAATSAPSQPAATPVLGADGRAPDGAVTYPAKDSKRVGAWVQRGVIVADGGPASDAAEAALSYLGLRVQLSNTWTVDKAALARVATGQALSGAMARLSSQRAAHSRSVGPFVLNLSRVTVAGSKATAVGCPFDGTLEISDKGSRMSDAPGSISLAMKLVRGSGGWQVSSFSLSRTICEKPAP